MLAKIFKSLITFYAWFISPLLGNNCRYTPSCSEYAHESIERFGAFKGGWMTVKRLSRCHPWGGSGFDPVPEKQQSSKNHDKST